jgi:integrase/recombinase XerD
MANRINYKFYLRKDQTAKSGGLNIYLYANVNSEKVYLSIGSEINPKYWSEKDQSAKNGFKNTTLINQRIAAIEKDIIFLTMDADLKNKVVSIEDIKKIIKTPINKADLIEYMKQTAVKEYNLKIIAFQTKCNYLSLAKKLSKIKPVIWFSELTPDLWSKIERSFVLDGNSKNTIFQYLIHIKSFITRAIKEGVTNNNPLESVKVKKEKKQRDYLSIEEVEKLELYLNECTDLRDRNALNAFLFGCYTGIRLSDITGLKWSDIVEDWVIFTAQKTNTPQRNPLSVPALKILNSIKKSKKNIFTFGRGTINKRLKEIFLSVGIKKKITFHCSRHTFATISLNLSHDIATVSKLLGHSKISTTEIYAQTMDENKTKVINLWDRKAV